MHRHTATRSSAPLVAAATRAGSALAALVLTAATALVGATATPAVAAGCSNPPKPTQVLKDVPWPLAMWDLSKLPPSPGGPAVTVAVLDSGVSATHQLSGQVISGSDKLATGNGQEDCVGHGTGVASLIAAKPVNGIGFRGLAPRAKILPIRVSEKSESNPEGRQATAPQIAVAVTEAVARGARVINLSFAYSYDDDSLKELRAAIEQAVRSNVVVVAAAGNNHLQAPPSGAPVVADPISYPAAWPGVLGVGAIMQSGQRLDQSQVGSYVDLVAPGHGIIIANPAGGHLPNSAGTSFAAPLVAGTAALIMEYYPNLTAEQVIARLLATTDPAAGGNRSEGYGIGVVNPVRAVTELVDGSEPLPAAKAQWPTIDPQQVAAEQRETTIKTRASWIAGIGLLGAALAVLLTVALPAAIRRRWRPAGRPVDQRGRAG